MGLKLAHLRFHPSAVGTVLVLILLPTFTGLGLWQLQRADSKAAQFESFRAQAELPILTSLSGSDVPRYARVRLRGRFMSSRQFLLDNMTHAGRSGYHVLTPFLPENGERWLLVNRGWVPAPTTRDTLPDVALVAREGMVSGQLDLLPRPGLDLQEDSVARGGWPRVVFFPAVGELAAQLNRPLHDYQLLLDPDQPDGFLRQWGPRSMAPEKHLGYAVQWFAFAVVLVVLYVTLNLRRVGP